ncbi:MAG: LapA family protein [Desulfitobacteriaceae bacterium]
MFILFLSLMFALLVAVFAVQNANLVGIQFFWIEAKVPLVLVILGSALAGAVVTILLALWREFRSKRKGPKLSVSPLVPEGIESTAPPEGENK